MRATDRKFGHRSMLVLSAAAAALAIATHSRLDAADRPVTKTTGPMRVRVVDAAGSPIANAQIHASVWTQEKDFNHNRDYTTDKDGFATVELPSTLEIVRVWARHKGCAPMFAQLWPRASVDAHALPEEFTFELVQGTAMGGTVVDDDGKPIPGARVEVRYDSGGVPGRTLEPATYDDWLAYGVAGRITDADGRWSIDNVPPGDKVEVRLKFTHRDHVSETAWGGLQQEQGVTARQLRDASATIVMQRGSAVAGTVTAPDGQPIADALVVEGENRQWQDGRGETRTDKDGKFRLGGLPAGQVRINILAEGWMPESRSVDDSAAQPVDFQLRPGKKLRLKFVDKQGQGVPQVYVYPGQWRGMEQIGGRSQSKVGIPRIGDSQGLYEWSWAPDDAVKYSLRTKGFANAEVTITADGDEHVVTLTPVLQLAGTVRDAATDQSIADVRAIPVIFFRPDFPLLNRREAAQTDDGTFRLEFDRTDIEHGVQIEAPGYFTFRTDGRFKIGDPNQQLDVRLQPAPPYAGRVHDGEGRPVADAKLYVATGFQHCDLYNLVDRDEGATHNYHATSDHAGAFEIVAQSDDYTLIVVAPGGYASVARRASELPGELQIEPWASVRGRVVQNGQPVPNHTVYCLPIRLRGGGAPWIDYSRQQQPTTMAVLPSTRFRQAPSMCGPISTSRWSRSSNRVNPCRWRSNPAKTFLSNSAATAPSSPGGWCWTNRATTSTFTFR